MGSVGEWLWILSACSWLGCYQLQASLSPVQLLYFCDGGVHLITFSLSEQWRRSHSKWKCHMHDRQRTSQCWWWAEAEGVFLLRQQRCHADADDRHVLKCGFKASTCKTCCCSHHSCGKDSIDFLAVGASNNSFFLRSVRIISKFAHIPV